MKIKLLIKFVIITGCLNLSVMTYAGGFSDLMSELQEENNNGGGFGGLTKEVQELNDKGDGYGGLLLELKNGNHKGVVNVGNAKIYHMKDDQFIVKCGSGITVIKSEAMLDDIIANRQIKSSTEMVSAFEDSLNPMIESACKEKVSPSEKLSIVSVVQQQLKKYLIKELERCYKEYSKDHPSCLRVKKRTAILGNRG